MKKAFLFLSLLSMVSWEKQYPTTNVSQGNELESLEKNVNKKDIDISGTWEYIKKNKGANVPEATFTLKIIQKGNQIKAQYCAIARSGGKIDCENDTQYNITGTLKDKRIIAEFYSFFGSPKDKGKVKITVNNDKTLTWKVIKDPKSPFYCPGECILTQQK